ncbi:transaldolase [Burkholderia sp. GAS332]|nr:transaldolase [Burkholderia sp. GAS332]
MNQLEQIRQYTTVTADTGNFNEIVRFSPQDATTDPTLILKAVRQPEYEPLSESTVPAHRSRSVPEIVDNLLVSFWREILDLVPGRASTEVDARLSFDTVATVERGRRIMALYEVAGVTRDRVLIKIAAIWEGIQAADILEREGIHCNLTLVFSFCQAAASALLARYNTCWQEEES